jgi:hypothetical protein
VSLSKFQVLGALSLAAMLAGCSSTDSGSGGILGGSGQQTAALAPAPAAVQGTCPLVSLRDGTSFFRTYERGGEDDASRVIHQASLAETTRQCALSGEEMTISVTAAGRVAAGPRGGPGNIDMPVRVAVLDGDTVLYSQLTRYQATIPQGGATTQFVFNDPNVRIPASAASRVRVFVGFDEGPYDTP